MRLSIKSLIILSFAAGLIFTVALAILFPTVQSFGQAIPTPAVDVCFSNTLKTTVPVNITTATTTSLVSGVAGQKIYFCTFIITTTGATTSTTFQFEYGTGASCTTPTVLTGTMGANQAVNATITTGAEGDGSVLQASAAGQNLCLVSAGTTVSVQGFIDYIQQ